ncbi:MAG: HflC protein [bacterium]|nr:MAG: HflC protein [bacterium]
MELIRSSNRTPDPGDDLLGEAAVLDSIQFGRDKIRKEILSNAQRRTTDLGIEILDLQFRRINYVEEVRIKVYERMIAERQRIAERFRSEGEGEASRINGERERELKRIQSEAYRTAREIVGRADARTTAISAAAYDQSVDSRAFYSFLKTMETYQNTIDPQSLLILSTNSEIYRMLKGK